MDYLDLIAQSYGINNKLIAFARRAEEKNAPYYKLVDDICGYNQIKVLNAFRQCGVTPTHFAPTYGYGYDDYGRDKLEELFCTLFKTEAALVRPQFVSGTHALAVALLGTLRAGDELVSMSGTPYDTLHSIIGKSTADDGSLAQLGVKYSEVALIDGIPDENGIADAARRKPRMMMLQRSRGYNTRPSISVALMEKLFAVVKSISPDTIIMVDNCYGEFVDYREPSEVGADIVVGSLIKNPGGGLAPTGAYITGKRDCLQRIAYRLTSPGIGAEEGSYAASYMPFFQGLYLAPRTVNQALKGAIFASSMYAGYGYTVSPAPDEKRACIIQTVSFDTEEQLTACVQAVQRFSPVDSDAVPVASEMPGYEDLVIMAAGTFVQGATTEFSADAPIREPYTAFMQGGLASEQVKAAVLAHLNEILVDF